VIPDEIATVLKSSSGTHLIVLTKYRGEARLQAAQFNLDSGKLAGLGFYVDRQYRLSRTDTGQRGIGFPAPFVCIKLSFGRAQQGRRSVECVDSRRRKWSE
jgi:hypothetical protein